jgi:hypothetical protein
MTEIANKVVIGWAGMPIEMAVAGFEGDIIFLDRTHELSDYVIAACKNSDVVVFGTYWKPASINALTAVAKSVVNVIYDASCSYIYGSDLPTISMHAPEVATTGIPCFRWSRYGTFYLSLLRRGKTQSGGTDEDEYFYRGVELAARKESLTFDQFCRANKEHDLYANKGRYIDLGQAIALTDNGRALATAEQHGMQVKVGGHSAWLVVGPWTPVQPYTDAAAAVAATKGCQLGLFMRYSAGLGLTAFSARPTDASPDDVVAFMYERESFRGGGPPRGPGATIPGIVPLPIHGDLLEAVKRVRLEADSAL